MTLEQIDLEMQDLRNAYHKRYPNGNLGFLVGSSLVHNKQGDSARYWELKEILEEIICQNNSNKELI